MKFILDTSVFPQMLRRLKDVIGVKTQKDLSEALGITPSTLSTLRKLGEGTSKSANDSTRVKNIPFREILEFAIREDIDIRWLLTGEGSPESATAEKTKPETLPTTLEDFQRWAVTACERDPKLEQWLSIELNIIKNRAALNTPQIKGGDDD